MKLIGRTIFVLSMVVLLMMSVHAQSTRPRLSGTKWKGATDVIVLGGLTWHTDYDYSFSDDQRMSVAFTSQVAGYTYVSEFNISSGRWEQNYKFIIRSSGQGVQSGTYQLDNKTITFRFPMSDRTLG